MAGTQCLRSLRHKRGDAAESSEFGIWIGTGQISVFALENEAGPCCHNLQNFLWVVDRLESSLRGIEESGLQLNFVV